MICFKCVYIAWYVSHRKRLYIELLESVTCVQKFPLFLNFFFLYFAHKKSGYAFAVLFFVFYFVASNFPQTVRISLCLPIWWVFKQNFIGLVFVLLVKMEEKSDLNFVSSRSFPFIFKFSLISWHEISLFPSQPDLINFTFWQSMSVRKIYYILSIRDMTKSRSKKKSCLKI